MPRSHKGQHIKYPRHRKSPIRHQVKGHTREGHRVRSFVRGKGSRQVKPTFTTKRSLGKPGKAKSFTVNFKYSNRKGDGESLIVISTDFHKALDEAFEEKKDRREPIEVEVLDPNLGRVLRTIGRGAAKAAYLGTKYTIKGVKALGKEAGEELAKLYRDYRVKKLVETCYDPSRVRRTMARSKLKRLYPEIYSVCDFSSPGERAGITVPISVKVKHERAEGKPAKVLPKMTSDEYKAYVQEAKTLAKMVERKEKKLLREAGVKK